MEIACATGEGSERLAKLIRFGSDGRVTVQLAWDAAAFAAR